MQSSFDLFLLSKSTYYSQIFGFINIILIQKKTFILGKKCITNFDITSSLVVSMELTDISVNMNTEIGLNSDCTTLNMNERPLISQAVCVSVCLRKKTKPNSRI